MRIRRHQPTRLEGFVDASFAFAVTLVVISIGHVPASVAEMLTALRGLPAFAASFLMITRIWLSHRDWSRHYDLDDPVSTRLSLILVLLVLIYVYPLRMLFAQMFLGLSHGWLSDGSVVGLVTLSELNSAYVVFGLGLGSISLIFVLLFRHALHHAQSIGLDAGEVLLTRMRARIWCVQVALALGSILVTLGIALLPDAWVLSMPGLVPWIASAPGLVYAINTVSGRIMRRKTAHAIAQLPASA
jgi:hypothetical protein